MSSDDPSDTYGDRPESSPPTPQPQPRIGLQRQGRARKQTGDAKKRKKPNLKRQLQGRLQEIALYELPAEGEREYKTMTLRELYNYVMKSITSPSAAAVQTSSICLREPSKSISSRKQLLLVSPVLESRPKVRGSVSRERSGSVGVYQPESTLGPPPLLEPTGSKEKRNGTAFPENQKEKQSEDPTPTTAKKTQLATSNVVSAPPLNNESTLLNASVPGRSEHPPVSSSKDKQKIFQTKQRVSFQDDSLSFPPLPSSLGRRTATIGGSDGSISKEGAMETQERGQIAQPTSPQKQATYRERLGGYLHPRDMRRLVTPFSSTNTPELMVRRHVMLLNFDKLRAIVLRDRLLIILPDGADSILTTLERKLYGGLDEVENEVFGVETCSTFATEESACAEATDLPVMPMASPWDVVPTTSADIAGGEVKVETPPDTTEVCDVLDEDGDGEWIDINERNWIEMAFELQAVDTVLSSVCMMLSDDALELRKEVYIAMDVLRGSAHKSTPGEHAQEKLRLLKDKVGEMQTRVGNFVRAINLVLDEDEDMALMNLSRLLTHPERFIQPVSPEILEEESDDPELILEAYLQQALSVVNTLELMKGNIVSTEELVSMMLDTVRNRLLYINTILSLASLCVATASLVGSIFGMNLLNGLEDNEDTFWQVAMGTMIGSLALMGFLAFAFNRAMTVPKSKHM